MPHEASRETPETLTIGDMAARCDLSEHTLRYYERVGLIQPVPRDRSSGHRRYSAETAAVVETLACLRRSGMSLEDMRCYLALRPRGAAAAPQQTALFQAHLQQLEQEAARLEVRREYLRGKVAYWSAQAAGDAEEADRIAQANREVARRLR